MADNIKEALGDKADDPVDLGDDGFSPDQFKSHEMIFVGAPTWNTDQEESRTGTEWDDVMQDGLPSLDGTPVAIFGLGDSTGYADYFCDAIEELHDNFQKAGAKMVGYTPDNVYPGISSKSIRDGKFLGCPIDVIEAEPDADERIISWAAQAVGEAGL